MWPSQTLHTSLEGIPTEINNRRNTPNLAELVSTPRMTRMEKDVQGNDIIRDLNERSRRPRHRYNAYTAVLTELQEDPESHRPFHAAFQSVLLSKAHVSRRLKRTTVEDLPRTYKDLRKHPNQEGFRVAMDKEY